MINPIVDIIYGGQYGSEAKRLFNEYYFEKYQPNAIVSNFGPNSGGFVSDGGKWATFSMGAECLHMLSPGSVIDIIQFYKEIDNLPEGAEVIVHENACVVLPEHKELEKEMVSIGSTMTGTAAAYVQKMQRSSIPENQNIAKHHLSPYTVRHNEWFDIMSSMKRIQLAVPQGHSLSINHGIYPYCTSRNTSPQQAIADAGIPISWVDRIIACMRTFPIRVSNRYNDDGEMIGYSGCGYFDQKETTWEEIGVPAEMTSVSKKVRRVFTFSKWQYAESCKMNGATDVFLNFMNYLTRHEAEKLFVELSRIGPKISWCGYGPKISDIAHVKRITPEEEIDGRLGCHPTMFGIQNEE